MDFNQYKFLRAAVDKEYQKKVRELEGRLEETRSRCSHVRVEDAERLSSGARMCPKCGVELKLAATKI